jgi:hypothetical protein
VPLFKPDEQGKEKKCKMEISPEELEAELEAELEHEKEVRDNTELLREEARRKKECCGMWDTLSSEEAIRPLTTKCLRCGALDNVSGRVSARSHTMPCDRALISFPYRRA